MGSGSAATRRPIAASWLVAASVGCGVGALLFRSYHLGHAQSFDPTLYARSLWGLAHGEAHNPVAGVHALAIHGHFGLLPLAPFARIFSALQVLVVAQALALIVTLGATASAVADIAAGVPERRWAAQPWLMVLAASLGAPLVLNPFLFDVRPDVYAIPLATIGLLRAERRNAIDLGALLWLFSATLCREEMAAVCLAAALALEGPRRLRGLLAVVPLLYWAGYFWGVRWLLGGELAASRAADSVATLVGDPSALDTLTTKLLVLGVGMLGILGLPLQGGRFALLAVPGLLMLLGQNRMPDDLLRFHYGMFAAPALLAASVRGLRRTLSMTDARLRVVRLFAGAGASVWCFVVASAAPFGGLFFASAFGFDPQTHMPSADTGPAARAHQLVAAIPDSAAVVSHFAFAPPLADRAQIRTLDGVKKHELMHGLPADVDTFVLLPQQWGSIGRLLILGGGHLWNAEPGVVAVIGREPPTTPPTHLTRVKHPCTSPVGRWPEVGLIACELGRFRDGRVALVLRRENDYRGPMQPLLPVLSHVTGEVPMLALDGILDPGALSPGYTMRVLADAPREAGLVRVRLFDTSGKVLATDGTQGAQEIGAVIE
jgi:hypothetical protein